MTRRSVLAIGLLAAGAALFGAAGCGGGDGPSAEAQVTVPAPNTIISRVTPEHGAELIQQLGSELTVIDVRTADEFASGHIDGAVNYDIEAGQFTALIAPLDRSKPYMVYCHSGRRSGIAADVMAAAGFTQVYDLGGLPNWQSAGFPVVGG